MDNMFNSPVMIKLQEFGQALGRNKFLSALQGGMMSLMAVIMVGAIFQIICAVGGPTMLNLFASDSQIYTVLYTPYNFTMNMISLWLVTIMSFNYARNLNIKSPIISVVECVSVFLLTCGALETTVNGNTGVVTTYLGAQGMFMGFLIVFVVVNIDKLCAEHNIYIKMPDMVPTAIQNGFAGIVPLLFNAAIFLAVNTAISVATGGAYTLPSGFMALLGAPLAALTSVPGMVILVTFAAFLWCFGIHGTIIVSSIVSAVAMQAATTNGELVAAGEPAVFSAAFLFTYIQICGGTGETFSLVLLSLRSKSEQMRAVGRAGLVPGWFCINEPVTFGMPVMYNPILCIPYILNVIVVVLLAWLAMDVFGIISIPWIYASALIPIGTLSYLKTLDIRNAIFDYVMLIPTALVWYPFFKAYEKQLVAQEEEARRLEAEQA